MELSLLVYLHLVGAAFAAPPSPLQSLIHALTLAYAYGPWLVFTAIAYRMLCPFLKGGR